ncbi:MAG: sigma-54-dependent Fis family transcriptional regulator [Deltaproteobacteria bacterium RIFOXYD12_FULL_57_12]|nr:MAG: sigma-54-dependent Fis family transcriptional regulator [Deltaproteobacteria bacterium RIFOXYD12_FULL_57_12]
MGAARILLVEDDEIMRVTLYDRLKKQHWLVDQAVDGREALRLIETETYHLVLSDIRMPGLDGNRLLEEVVRLSPDTDVILMTAFGSADDAVACLKKGAADYILKPFDPDDLIIRICRLLEMRAIKARCQSLEEGCGRRQVPIVGSSPAIRTILNMIGQVAMTDASVLITGESGTGKELIAAAIHYGSRRADHPYVCINCAAIAEGLIESELFGHEKGAFTGAVARKIGRFEMANNGTILLDEIGDLPLALQAKLLRVLQEREIERVGGTRTIKVDVRLICATARKLAEEVEKGNFREDLFYRLQVIPIEAPALRNRKEDIPELCRFFLDEFSRERGVHFRLSDEALKLVMAYDFPGNVRELRNIMERATVLAHSPVIEPWNLPLDLAGAVEERGAGTMELAVVLAKTEKSCILRALQQTVGNKTEAARLLGISRKNLWEKMKLHQIPS